MEKDELTERLKKESLNVLDELEDISSSNEEYTVAVNNLSKLVEMQSKLESTECEEKNGKKEILVKAVGQGADIAYKICVLGLTVTMFVMGLHFEERGTLTSFVFKDSLKRFLRF